MTRLIVTTFTNSKLNLIKIVYLFISSLDFERRFHYKDDDAKMKPNETKILSTMETMATSGSSHAAVETFPFSLNASN